MASTTTLSQLREAADLVTVAARFTDLKFVHHDQSYRGKCPLHSQAENPTSFHVFRDGQGDWRFVCYSCGERGDVFAFLAAKFGTDYQTELLRWKEDNRDWRNRPTPERPAPPPRPAALPLPQRQVLHYHHNLRRRTSLGATAYEWWKAQGIGPATISRFQLGYAPVCPTRPEHDSFTIPVIYRSTVLNIRHRLARAGCAGQPAGNKYRPQRSGLGAHLFNADSLDIARPDDALIVEGEKKVMVLTDQGIETVMPVVSATGGVTSWLRDHGQAWYELLLDFKRIFVLFDPEPESLAIAQRTAKLFGRRGYVAHLPQGKVDDVITHRETGMAAVINCLANARPAIRV